MEDQYLQFKCYADPSHKKYQISALCMSQSCTRHKNVLLCIKCLQGCEKPILIEEFVDLMQSRVKMQEDFHAYENVIKNHVQDIFKKVEQVIEKKKIEIMKKISSIEDIVHKEILYRLTLNNKEISYDEMVEIANYARSSTTQVDYQFQMSHCYNQLKEDLDFAYQQALEFKATYDQLSMDKSCIKLEETQTVIRQSDTGQQHGLFYLGEEIQAAQKDYRIVEIALSQDDQFLAAITRKDLKIWKMVSSVWTLTFEEEFQERLETLCFGQGNGHKVVLVASNYTINSFICKEGQWTKQEEQPKLQKKQQGQKQTSINQIIYQIIDNTFIIRGDILESLIFDDTQKQWKSSIKKSTKYSYLEIDKNIEGSLFAGTFSGQIKVINNTPYQFPQAHTDAVLCLRSEPDNILFSGSKDKSVKVWKLNQLQQIIKLHDSISIILPIATTLIICQKNTLYQYAITKSADDVSKWQVNRQIQSNHNIKNLIFSELYQIALESGFTNKIKILKYID